MKNKLYNSKLIIFIFILSMLMFYASTTSTLKYTFYLIHLVSALFLINKLNKN